MSLAEELNQPLYTTNPSQPMNSENNASQFEHVVSSQSTVIHTINLKALTGTLTHRETLDRDVEQALG